jgi:hypothetical protein
MRRGIFLLGILVFCSVASMAQGPAGVGAGSVRAVQASGSESPSFLLPWRFSVGYQYNRFNLTGTPFNTTGVNGSVSRVFNNWFGVEGQVGFGVGNTGSTTSPANLTAKSTFVAGGPRLVHRGRSRLELWVHALGGMEHFRFSETAGGLGSNTGLAGMLGGGADFRLSRKVAITGEGDELGTRFFGGYQRHFQAVTSLVFHY